MLDIINQFNPGPHQSVVLDHLSNNRFSIIMNSEETDIISTYALFLIDYVLTNTDKTIVVCSNKAINGKAVKEKMFEYYNIIEPNIDVKLSVYNTRLFAFTNGCNVKFYATHKNTAIGFDVDCFIIMDMAHTLPSEVKELYIAMYPTLTCKQNTRMIINSSPNGTNLFYDLFTNSELPAEEPNKNDFVPLRLYYWQAPGRDGKWVQDKIKEVGADMFNERYNLIARTSSRGVFNIPGPDELTAAGVTGYTVTFHIKEHEK